MAPFRELLDVVGLPDFGPLVKGLDASLRPEYFEAAVTGLRVSHLVPGAIAIVAGLIAFVVLGRRDPVRSVWEYADERAPDPNPEPQPLEA